MNGVTVSIDRIVIDFTDVYWDFFNEFHKRITMMKKAIDYDTVHEMALKKYDVSRFSVYHADVIKSMPDIFNKNWRKFWGLDE